MKCGEQAHFPILEMVHLHASSCGVHILDLSVKKHHAHVLWLRLEMANDPNSNGLLDHGGVLEFATGTHNSLTGLGYVGFRTSAGKVSCQPKSIQDLTWCPKDTFVDT